MCLTPSVGVVDDSTQFFPVGLARHGAVSTKDEVGRCILQHLIDSGLAFSYLNDKQTVQLVPECLYGGSSMVIGIWFVGHDACSLIVLLTEPLDGIGTFQGVDRLGIVHLECLVKVGEIIIDV